MIHTTIGLYANGSYKINGVQPSDLEAHIEYNLNARPGRAFIVDGACINEGIVSSELIDEFLNKMKLNPDYYKMKNRSDIYI